MRQHLHTDLADPVQPVESIRMAKDCESHTGDLARAAATIQPQLAQSDASATALHKYQPPILSNSPDYRQLLTHKAMIYAAQAALNRGLPASLQSVHHIQPHSGSSDGASICSSCCASMQSLQLQQEDSELHGLLGVAYMCICMLCSCCGVRCTL